jgi:uncharacterized membrane protein
MKRRSVPLLATGMGAVAGLRAMVAPAVLSWAATQKMIPLGDSPVGELVLAKASKKVMELALGELIADKLPFTPDRVSPGPMAVRVISGAACGAAISYSARQPVQEGAGFGALGAIVGAFAGYYIRKKLSRQMPAFAVALAEDALAIGAGFAIVSQLSE